MLNQQSYSPKYFQSEKKRNISSDKLLWNSFKEGSRKSFHYIYDQNFECLLNYGLKVSSDQALVEDQIHELFIYLWQKKENLDIHGSITVYLLWSLRNRIISHLKTKREYVVAKEDDLIQEEDDRIREGKFEDLDEAISELPPKQKEAISLKYFQNLDGEEITKVMGITIGTTYNLLSRAIENLRKHFPVTIFLLFFQEF